MQNEIILTTEDTENVDILGTMLSYPRTEKAKILFGKATAENIKKVDLLQEKYYPSY
jgi:hypothetical protein